MGVEVRSARAGVRITHPRAVIEEEKEKAPKKPAWEEASTFPRGSPACGFELEESKLHTCGPGNDWTLT